MRIGVDTGGTFTDVVAACDDGTLRAVKLRSTPRHAEGPARAVLDGVLAAGGREADAATEVIHGTTVGTNALLERRGGPTALVTTAGFEDSLVLRRHHRPRLYELHPRVPPPLVPDALRFGLPERLAADGAVVLPLDEAALDALVDRLRELVDGGQVSSLAVSLLHCYANPEHERRVAARLAVLGVPLSLSSEVLPEHREYERTSTTVADAYLAPPMASYLGRLGAALPSLRVMRSSGGAASAASVARRPVGSILSGPAAGVIGAHAVAAAAGLTRLITLDMGGTSTDVALVDGVPAPEIDEEGTLEIDGVVVRQPSLRVHTIGAGGGSIAWRDPGGALKVGPRSAGAQPGPACYGAGGTEPTVTDAALVLGRVPSGPAGMAGQHFLDGALCLDEAAAGRVMDALASSLCLPRGEAAAGIGRVAVALMARAITTISTERGHDPRDHALVAFGGAGGLFACDVAEALEIPRVFIPPAPGLLCAYGALVADVATDHVVTRFTDCPAVLTAGSLAAEFAPLEAAAQAALQAEGIPPERRLLHRRCDVRYRGQSYELSVDLPDPAAAAGFDITAAFHDLHGRRYGFADPTRPVERIALRVQGRGLAPPAPPLRVVPEPGEVRVGELHGVPVLLRSRLGPATRLEGPAVIVEYSATTWLPRDWAALVGDGGGLIAERR